MIEIEIVNDVISIELANSPSKVYVMFLPEEIGSYFTIPSGQRFVNFESLSIEAELVIEGTLMMEV